MRRLRAAGRLGGGGLPLSPAARLSAVGPLRFPGKLCRLNGRRLVISDTGHHRLLVTDNGGNVMVNSGGDCGVLDFLYLLSELGHSCSLSGYI